MPAEFDKCVKNGGKVVTLSLGKDKYMHACKMPNGGWAKGEVKMKKKKNEKNS